MMHDKLTVLIQTSPIPSHPSTALLEALFRSFQKADGLLEARIVILADGCEELTVPNHHQSSPGKQVENFKHGKASSKSAENYGEHLKRLRQLVQNQTPPFCPQPGGSVELLELKTRHGSAPAIRAAMDRVVTTPLVMVCQHDNFFVNEAPVRAVVDAMLQNQGLGVGLTCLHFLSTATMNYQQKVKRRYNLDIEPVSVAGLEYPLVPLVFWYGRSHICYSDYARSYVLNRELAKGSHLEELLGEKQLHDILKRGVEVHTESGTYVLDQGVEVLYHLSGRRAIAAPEDTKKETPASDAVSDSAESMTQSPSFNNETAEPLEGAFTTARSCRAIVPGLQIVSEDAATTKNDKTEDKSHSNKPFKQRCFRCGEKGHSKKFCPQNDVDSAIDAVEIIDLS